MRSTRGTAALWFLLVAISAAFSAVFEFARLPAALLLGPMIGGILFGTNGVGLRVPRIPFLGAQAIIGCLVANAITSDIVATFIKDWPVFLAALAAMVTASSALGWAMSRLGVLPGTTAIWGSSPGGALPMILMAEAYGGDARLVAFMQYARVVLVAAAASILARFWLGASGAPVHARVWFPPIHEVPFAETLALAAIGGLLGSRLRIPAGVILAPIGIGAVLHALGLLQIELPPWLLATAYALVGWSVGFSFTRTILLHALRALPQILLSIFLLICVCGGVAVVLTHAVGVDLLTAYLATSPGGLDSVAIIAATSKVDVPFVMTLQTMRLLMLMFVGPPLAKSVIRFGMKRRPPQ